MKTMILACACTLTASLLTGCYIRKDGGAEDEGLEWDTTEPSCGDDGSGNAGSGGNGGSTGQGGGGGSVTCADHADCEAGSYCEAELCVPSATCDEQTDCGEGFVCDDALATCIPGIAACEDLETEAACSARSDCEPVYAGIDCSCGPDCTCIGGEPGCVCESFEFFACSPVAL